MSEDMRVLAAQLRKPEGELGEELANNMSSRNINLTNQAIDSLNLKSGDTVIELGAGNGRASTKAIEIIGEQGRYIAIDHSDDMLRAVEGHMQEQGFPGFDLVHGNCLEIDNDFGADGIFASNFLYFIDDLSALLRQMRTWGKSGARFAFAVRSKTMMQARPFTAYNFKLRDEAEYKAEFKKAGQDCDVQVYQDELLTLDIEGFENSTPFYIISGVL